MIFFNNKAPLALVFVLTFYLTNSRIVLAAKKDQANPLKATIQKLINAIRYKKDELANQFLAHRDMAEHLLGPQWQDFNEEEQQEIVEQLAYILRKASFAKGRQLFQYLDAILYESPRQEANRYFVKSTLVINRDLKKTEIIVDWVLIEEAGRWKITDTISMGESTTEGIRQSQVLPLLKVGGKELFLKTLHKKYTELKG